MAIPYTRWRTNEKRDAILDQEERAPDSQVKCEIGPLGWMPANMATNGGNMTMSCSLQYHAPETSATPSA
jgi:hypothetical protein